MGTRIRRRVDQPSSGKFQVGTYYTIDTVTNKIKSQQKIFSGGSSYPPATEEYCMDELHEGPPFKDGGSLFTSKIYRPSFTIVDRAYYDLDVGPPAWKEKYTYDGGFCEPYLSQEVTNFMAGFGQISPTVTSAWNPNDLSNLGNRAYNKLRPKVEVAGLGQFLAEIHDTPDMLKTTAAGFAKLWKSAGGSVPSSVAHHLSVFSQPKSLSKTQQLRAWSGEAGGHFLNHQFAWVPFVRDVVGVCDVAVNGDKYIERTTRGNDKWSKRMFTEENIESEKIVYTFNGWGCGPSTAQRAQMPGTQALYTITRKESTRVWYKGCFKSYRAEFDNKVPMHPAVRTVRQYMTLLGANVNPVLLYKVTPWTWLVDWFTNVGDTVQRLQDLGSGAVVSQYFYLMRTINLYYEMRQLFTDRGGVSHDMRWHAGAITKSRSSSVNPFGFALNPAPLSGIQYAILAALGASHLAP